MALKKATRKRVKLKLAVTSQSGGGKTCSSLLMAYGLVKGLHPDWDDDQIWDAIAVIDTENESASQYANADKAGFHIGEFGVPENEVTPPFTSEKYIRAINECAEGGVEVCIIDSLTHLWDGEGGAKDKQANIAKRTGNGFTSWREPKKEFRNVIDKILQTDMHFIVTMRSKTDYVQEKDSNGKTTIRKVGLAPIIAEGTDYEFTTVFDLDADHVAGVSKDRTGLFDGTYHKITPETGVKFAKYLLSSPEVKHEPKSTVTTQEEESGHSFDDEPSVEFLVQRITSTFKSLMDIGIDKEILYNVVAENNGGKKNWMGVKDVEVAKNILTALNNYTK